jgi:hypothetical protein
VQPPSSDTQPLVVWIHGLGEPREARVDWPLDGPTLRSLLATLLARLGLGALTAGSDVQLDATLVGSLDVSLRQALTEALIALDPERPVSALVHVAPAPAYAPPSAPAARPSAPATGVRPPAPSAPAASYHRPPEAGPPASRPSPVAQSAPRVDGSRLNSVRRATVEYFTRMSPQRVFPLKVTLAPWSVQHELGPDVARVVSESFTVDPEKWIEIEPVLPGCTVYPAKLSVPGGAALSEVRFWVVPQVKGEVPGTVYLRHGDQQRLVRLKVTVAEPRRAAWTAAAALVMPYASVVLKHQHLDFESQLDAGFPLYARALRWVLAVVGPAELAALLLAVAAGLWLTTRPKRATADEALDAPLYAT